MPLLTYQNIHAIVVQEPSGEFVGSVTNIPEHVVVSGWTLDDVQSDFSEWCIEYLGNNRLVLLSQTAELSRIQGQVAGLLEVCEIHLAKEALFAALAIDSPLVAAYARSVLDSFPESQDMDE